MHPSSALNESAGRLQSQVESKPVVDLSGGDFAGHLQRTREALRRADVPPSLFWHETGVVELEGKPRRSIALREVSQARMLDLLTRQVDFMKTRAHGGASVKPDREIVAAMLADRSSFPWLRRILHAPHVGRDGTITTSPGYLASDHLYLDLPPDLIGLRFPRMPNQEQVKAAIRTLGVPWKEFHFVSTMDWANAVMTTVLPFLFDLVDGPFPFLSFQAPPDGSGAGKTLAADVAPNAYLGRNAIMGALPDKESERSYTLLAVLLRGHAVYRFDNVRVDLLNSPALEALVTTRLYSGRPVGSARSVEVPNDTLFAITINGLVTTRDLARRLLPIRILPRPKGHRFRKPDLRSWIRTHRKRLVRAALVLIAAWVEAGRPRGKASLGGSFESFSAVAGGIADVAGLPFCERRELEAYRRSVAADPMDSFLDAWFQRFGSTRTSARTLTTSLASSLPSEFAGFKDAAKALGHRLRAIERNGHVEYQVARESRKWTIRRE